MSRHNYACKRCDKGHRCKVHQVYPKQGYVRRDKQERGVEEKYSHVISKEDIVVKMMQDAPVTTQMIALKLGIKRRQASNLLRRLKRRYDILSMENLSDMRTRYYMIEVIP